MLNQVRGCVCVDFVILLVQLSCRFLSFFLHPFLYLSLLTFSLSLSISSIVLFSLPRLYCLSLSIVIFVRNLHSRVRGFGLWLTNSHTHTHTLYRSTLGVGATARNERLKLNWLTDFVLFLSCSLWFCMFKLCLVSLSAGFNACAMSPRSTCRCVSVCVYVCMCLCLCFSPLF